MTQRATGPEAAVADGHQEPPVVIRDKRKLDPQTGQMRPEHVRQAKEQLHVSTEQPPAAESTAEATETAEATPTVAPEVTEPPAAEPASDDLAAERLADLQRLQAEYVNYRKRVERDKGLARDIAISEVAEALMPVLDDIQLAREHDDLGDGPFNSVAEKLETTLGRFGVTRFGAVGEEFDPQKHEALMNTPDAETTVATVAMVMQPGYLMGERVLRPARVGVKSPE